MLLSLCPFPLSGLLLKHPSPFHTSRCLDINCLKVRTPPTFSYRKSAYLLFISITLQIPIQVFMRHIDTLKVKLATCSWKSPLVSRSNTSLFRVSMPAFTLLPLQQPFIFIIVLGYTGHFLPCPFFETCKWMKQNNYQMWINKFSPLGMLFYEMGGK